MRPGTAARQVFAETAALPASRRSPKTSSVSDVRVTFSGDVFSTVTVKVTVPPGSSTLPTDGVLVTAIVGMKSPNATVAESESEAGVPSSSTTVAVTVLT